MKRIGMIVAGVALCVLAALGQWAPDSVRVSLVTVFPGPEIYELEGHTALRLQGPLGHDYAVNAGLFDFSAPNFVYRFVNGETDYMVGVMPWQRFLGPYLSQGRRIVQHPLPLTVAEKERLLQILDRQLAPENRTYRYNYVYDNCATRPLGWIEQALGDTLTIPGDPVAGRTFRQMMARYHANYPWYQFGIDLALGSGIDFPLTARQRCFAPAEIEALASGITDSRGRSLLAATEVIADAAADGATLGPTPLFLRPLVVCWVFFAIVVAVTVFDVRRGRRSRWLDSVMMGIYGLAGCLLTFLIFISVHEATSPNWLYGWLNPLCLFAAAAVWIPRWSNALRIFQIINCSLVGLTVLLWPLLPQHFNAAFLPLMLADILRGTYIIYKR